MVVFAARCRKTAAKRSGAPLWALLVMAFAGSAISAPNSGWAQGSEPPRFAGEVSATIGLGHSFRWDDELSGNGLNIGAGVAIVHESGFALEVESNRTRLSQVGGIRSATSVSVVVRYQFATPRFQPYLLAGVGALWSSHVSSEETLVDHDVVLLEMEHSDVGIGPDLGGGLRLVSGGPISIKAEIRWLDASLRSRANLGVVRLSIRVAYSW